MIQKIRCRPYHLLGLMAAILFAISIIHEKNPVDFIINDTYYVASVGGFEKLFAIYLCLLWLIYHFTFRFLFNNILIWVHIIDCLLIAIILATSLQRYYDFNTWESDSINGQVVLFLVLIALQACYTINLVLGKTKRGNHL